MGFVEKFYDGGGSLGSGFGKTANSETYNNAISGNAMIAAEENEENSGKSPNS
jgi:hypothetical protein